MAVNETVKNDDDYDIDLSSCAVKMKFSNNLKLTTRKRVEK